MVLSAWSVPWCSVRPWSWVPSAILAALDRTALGLDSGLGRILALVGCVPTRPEVINGNLQHRMETLRSLQRLLDEAFRVPGTNIRFGWDPIVGAVPWLGDALTALFSCAILVQAHHMRVPRIVQLRMLANVGLDLIAGAIPFVGDVADVFWKSNTKNFALLERHAAFPTPATIGDWLFAIALVAIVAAMALVPLFVLYWIINNVLPAHLPPLAR